MFITQYPYSSMVAQLNVEMADLERLIKKYWFKESLPLVEAFQTKPDG